MDAEIARLRQEYIEEFLSTLWEIHEQAQTYQRVLLTAKAEEKRSAFFASLGDTRALLQRGLANTRGNFVDQMNTEWDRLQGTQDYARAKLANESASLAGQLADGAAADQADLEGFNAEVADWLDERLLQVGHEIEQYVSGFDGYTNHYPFVPRGYTAPAKQIYGYAGHDLNQIDWLNGQTAVFNDDIQAAFVADTDVEVAKAAAGKDMIVATATNSNTDAIDELCLVTDTLIDFIETENDAAMTMLTGFYDECVETQDSRRAEIEESLETLKADILAELTELLEKLIASRGSRRTLWNRIKELIIVYHDAQDAAREDFAEMQFDTNAAWTKSAEEADAAYAAVLAQKEEDWQAASDVAAAAWAAALAKANEDIAALRQRALEAITILKDQKERELEVRYNALTQSISHIYDFHLQHKSQTALNDARDEAAAECQARYDYLRVKGEELQQAYDDAAAEQAQRHADAQAAKEAQCDTAVEEQGDLWSDYYADITADFDLFQDGEETGFNGALADWEVAFHEGVTLIKRRMFGYGRYGRW